MIRGDKVVLRTVRQTDLETLFELLSEVSNRGNYVPWDLPTQTSHQKQFQENGFWGESMGTLLICAAGQIVGTIAFVKAGCYDALEVGYTVFDESNRNKGFATEALFLFSKYLFSTRKVNRQQVSINPGNATSKRVAVK